MSDCFICSQLVRKQKQAAEDKRATAPSVVYDEASTSDFTDIPLSLPYQEPEEVQQDSVQPPEITGQPLDLLPEKQKTSSSQTLSTSASTKNLQSTVTPQVTEDLTESEKQDETDGVVKVQGTELKGVPQSTELEGDQQSWNQPCVSTQFEIPNVPSAPALYPSLQTLEEGAMIQFSEETVKNCGKGPAVLALAEQESSPMSLQPLESVADLSRSKLYPELPKTVPELQVIPYIM